MQKIIAVSLLASALIAGSAVAADAAPAKAMPGVIASEVARTEATVLVINEKERTVVLRSADGKVSEVSVPAARNLAQVKQGDIVVTEYSHGIAMQLKKAAVGAKATTDRSVSYARTPLGARPGVAEVHEVKFVANVIAVDNAASVVTLEGEKGRMVDLKVQDPKVLAEIKKGDQVEGVYMEALAIAVVPKDKAKKAK